MSHAKERAEKVCLNCGAALSGPYCHECGQHNIEPKETVWGLLVHYFSDITHFEGKFITTLRYLLFKPGFLTKEYELGRRASYMNPIRMYVFTSAFFFIIFFSIFKIDEKKTDINYRKLEETFAETNADFNVDFVSGDIKVGGVKVGSINDIEHIDKKLVDSLVKTKPSARADTTRKNKKNENDESNFSLINTGSIKYKSFEQYDSVQKALPKEKRDGWILRNIQRKSIEVDQKYGKNKAAAFARLGDVFLHKMPAIFFVTLPVFALILQLLYIRRKQFYYVNHLMFTIHYYIFSFIVLLFYFGIDKLGAMVHWGIFEWIKLILTLAIFFYLYKAMRNYYRQRRAKTIFKFIIFNFVFLIMVLLIFAGFLIFSAFNI